MKHAKIENAPTLALGQLNHEMTHTNTNSLPPRGSQTWQEAAHNAFKHPSGLFCFKGSLIDYPGFVDERHPRDCAVLDWHILERQIREKRYENKNHNMRDNYRLYLQHCKYARMTPQRPLLLDFMHYEPMRQRYQQDSNLFALPLPCYYDGNYKAFLREVPALHVIAPEAPIADLTLFYKTEPRGNRLQRMRDVTPQFHEWLAQHVDEFHDDYPDINWGELDVDDKRQLEAG